MLRRLVLFVVVTALLVAGAVWLADRPGDVTIHWQGWRVDTTVPILLIALVLLVAAMEIALRLVRGVVGAPRRWMARRRERRTREGYRALSDGLAAIAAGDTKAARKLARRADKMLGDDSLTGLLTARAAELAGDAGEAERRFRTMLDRPETAFVGLKGLMTQALERGDGEAALDFARRAWAARPGAEGLAATLFDLQAKAGQWAEAELTLAEAKRHGSLNGAERRHREALVLNERAALADAAGDVAEGARLALQAHKADPIFVPAAARAATLLGRMGKSRKAAAVLEGTFRYAPHAALADAWTALAPAEEPLARVKRMERLMRANPQAPESHVALAEAALAAKLWGQARTHLEAAAKTHPSVRIYTLLARIEREERGDEAAAQAWQAKAATAPADPTWVCAACGARTESWSVGCPTCGAIDRLVWHSPGTGLLPVPVQSSSAMAGGSSSS
ncbi:MAG: tetratricopeptide repeat protein [Magnetospirillum sp.]|nr:tetratricopeptide repeat protein [Magnetospirillum sp.]